MNERLDLDAIRSRLNASKGKEFWRSLDELAQTEEFQEFLHREFPRQASTWDGGMSRRRFLQLMGASLALAGLTGCGDQPPQELIVPYVEAPEEIIPGKPLYFATAMSLSGIATGLLVESHMGRPIKVEGNPDHPASLGATDAFAQAAVLTLYDPDRSQAVTQQGRIRTWNNFLAQLRGALDDVRARQGEGLRVLTESVSSPTLAAQLENLLSTFPAARWHQWEPVGRDNSRAGNLIAFGEDVYSRYNILNANVILSLDSDFLACRPETLRFVREFADRRRVWAGEAAPIRLYAVESSHTLTGANANHRLPLRATEVEAFARAVASRLGVEGVEAAALPDTVPPAWVDALVRDLQQNRGSSLIIAGDWQSPAVTALAHAMNAALDNVGGTVVYTEPVVANPTDQTESLRELVADMEAGRVELLLILSSNPVFTAPADLNFDEALQNVPLRVHLGLYSDETAALSHWHIPEAHFLESWSDARAFDGTVSIIQPLIEPLYGGRSVHEMLAALSDDPNRRGYDIVREFWQRRYTGDDFERFWRQAVHDGVVPGTELPPREVSLQQDWASQAAGAGGATPSETELEIIFRPDPNIYDGRFANNAWLQELPKPITKLTWDNPALISPRTAERLGLRNEDLVELHYQGRTVQAPIWVMPGHVDESVTVYLGYGRQRVGQVGTDTGFNAYLIRTSNAPWFDSGLEIRKTGRRYELATTQPHHTLAGRNLVRVATLEEFEEHPDFAQAEAEHIGEVAPQSNQGILAPAPPSLYPEYSYEGHRWGMAIDLSTCTGCNSCVIACQAENNIPIVGKEGVLRSREMHWLRVDSYFTGDPTNPETYFMPVPCMHCEKAPCEVVCPVVATVHSPEGLNEMIYNRCVGTRYCSNNCPYKVRRFNFLSYQDFFDAPSMRLLPNPDVTVRSRGIMEKCTYCVQRINAAKYEAQKEGRAVREGDILTACQAACPTQAIIFGDINDLNSTVRQMKETPLNYDLLGEIGTQPRTTYLGAVRNPNPEMVEG